MKSLPKSCQFGSSPTLCQRHHVCYTFWATSNREGLLEIHVLTHIPSSRSFDTRIGSSHFCSNTALLARAVSRSFFFLFAPWSDVAVHASQGMDLVPNAFWLVRGDSWSSSEVRGVATSAMAPSETRLVASSFRSVVQAASSMEVAARHNSPGQPGRCEGSSTTSDREVAECVGCCGRDRVSGGSGTSGCVEGSRTDSQRTCPRCSSRGMSGVHQTCTTALLGWRSNE